MKANEFVKKFGWGDVIKFVGWYGGDTSFKFLKVKEQTISVHSGDQPYDFHIDDLKRLVEAHEIIKLFKSLDHAKTEAQACEHSKHSEILVKLDVGVGYIWLSRVKQAILDVESCQ